MKSEYKLSDLEIISREPAFDNGAPPLLFIPGSGHGAWCWEEHFLPYLAANGFSSHAVSLRGHGKSKRPKHYKLTTISDYVADVRLAVASLRSHPILIGHSLGGLVVNKYLERYTAPAGILVAPSPVWGMFWPGLKAQISDPLMMLKIALKRDYSVMYSTPERVKRYLFSNDADLAKIRAYTAKISPEAYWASLETIFNLPRPRKIKTKLLIIGAENDAILSHRTMQQTARKLNAEFRLLPDIAHDMMLEANWKSAADLMIDWLRPYCND